MMDTQKPLISVYRILPFAAIFIETSYRYDASAGGHSNSHISLRGLLLHLVYTLQVSTLKSVIFLSSTEAWRVIVPLDVNL